MAHGDGRGTRAKLLPLFIERLEFGEGERVFVEGFGGVVADPVEVVEGGWFVLVGEGQEGDVAAGVGLFFEVVGLFEEVSFGKVAADVVDDGGGPGLSEFDLGDRQVILGRFGAWDEFGGEGAKENCVLGWAGVQLLFFEIVVDVFKDGGVSEDEVSDGESEVDVGVFGVDLEDFVVVFEGLIVDAEDGHGFATVFVGHFITGVEVDGFGVIADGFSEVALSVIGTPSSVVGFRVFGIDADAGGEVFDGVVEVAHGFVESASSLVIQAVVGREVDSFGVIADGCVVVLFGTPASCAVVKAGCVIRVEAEGGIEVGDGFVVLALVVPGEAAVVVASGGWFSLDEFGVVVHGVFVFAEFFPEAGAC